MLESITLIHPSKAQPQVVELGRLCPSFRDIQSSYQKLHELCMPGMESRLSLLACTITFTSFFLLIIAGYMHARYESQARLDCPPPMLS